MDRRVLIDLRHSSKEREKKKKEKIREGQKAVKTF